MRAREVAQLARAFNTTMDVVRSMTYRDVEAMVQVLKDEEAERKKAEAKARARKGR